MAEMIMNSGREKLSKARENCVGMSEGSYAEYIKVAVEWWGNVLDFSKPNSAPDLFYMREQIHPSNRKSYSEEEMSRFKNILAEEIIEEIGQQGTCTLSVYYLPCNLLEKAGREIGIPYIDGWPCKTTMDISENKVQVSYLYGTGIQCKTLWAK